MKTIGEVLKLSVSYLEERGVARARRMTEELLAHTLKKKRLELYMEFDRPLLETELQIMREKLKRKAQGEPLEYILGELSFFHVHLEVGPAVLIPRQETEILLSKVCEKLSGQNLSGKTAWDLCTGSGCLGIALKKKFPELDLTLSDLSREALEIAKKNGARNGVSVNYLVGDLLAPFSQKKADILLCNPPYVREEEYGRLDQSVRGYEPKLALVGGESGLEFYERLAKTLPTHLNPGAQLFFEIGAEQGAKVLELFQENCWKEKRLEKDWAGHDRFFFLEFE